MASRLRVDIPELLEAPEVSPLLVDLGPDEELVESDGVPLETGWHPPAIALLMESVAQWLGERTDYYTGGNTFIYYRVKSTRRRRFRGPDFFFVKGTSLTPIRRYWVVWEEGGRFPNAIIELLSPTTAKQDRTTKKKIYERTFRTPDYFCYDPDTQQLQGWRLNTTGRYEALVLNDRGWLWCEELGLWLGTWEGDYRRQPAVWLRFYTPQGELVLTEAESEHQLAESAQQQADEERRRADDLAKEVKRLQALLKKKGITPENGP
jgi:Uma2 family endonuclease